MKSNSTSKRRGPYGMGDVVKPHVLTYSGTFHQWLLRGVSASRTLPTICVHICNVAQVSFHTTHGKAGQQSGRSETAVRRESIMAPLSLVFPVRRQYRRTLSPQAIKTCTRLEVANCPFPGIMGHKEESKGRQK